MLSLLSAQYCARQHATAFLELWALLLVLCGGAAVMVFTGRPWFARMLLVFAALTAILGASAFYGCTATAANEQGLPTSLSAGTYTLLRCLGTDVPSTVNGWVLFVVSTVAAVALIVLGIVRRRLVLRVAAFGGGAVLLLLACALGFFLLFGFSWCESKRLI